MANGPETDLIWKVGLVFVRYQKGLGFIASELHIVSRTTRFDQFQIASSS